MVPLYSDVLPQSGATQIATDSVGVVARFLSQFPGGIHADGVQGNGYLIPKLIQQCTQFEELTGDAGDVVILHPFMFHRVSSNPSGRPRFIANNAVVLKQPMCFDRSDPAQYSLVELAVLLALGVDRFDFRPTTERMAIPPGPFRDEAEHAVHAKLLEQEKTAMVQLGHAEPSNLEQWCVLPQLISDCG